MRDESRAAGIKRRSPVLLCAALEHRKTCYFRSPQNTMPPDVFYRGYRIVSDVQEVPGTRFWRPKAAVVKPPDVSGVERVHPIITSGWYSSEDAAGDFVLNEAKEWIDADCGL
jgi:hypothetical protein